MLVPLVAPVMKSLLRSFGYYRRRMYRDAFPGPVVLCYHNALSNKGRYGGYTDNEIPFRPLQVTARRLEEHCKAVAETCHAIGLDQFAAGFDDRKQWPKRPVLMTFDDGYRNLLNVAAPILERFGIPAVVFVCTKPLPDGGLLWTDCVASELGDAEVERLKGVPDDERREFVAGIETKASPECMTLSETELKRLVDRFGWSVGGHSHSHPILARCRPDVQKMEIEENLESLERLLVRRPTAFAYPNGRPGRDYDATTQNILADCGVKCAFTTEAGFVVDASRPLDVPRMLMTDGVSGTELLHRLAVSWR